MNDQDREKMERLSFYQQLLIRTMDEKAYPWYRMIVEKNLSEGEVEDIYRLFKELERKKEDLREAGMLDQTSLLLHYVGMLNLTLHPFMTANALNRQGYFKSLTAELIEMMKEKESQIK